MNKLYKPLFLVLSLMLLLISLLGCNASVASVTASKNAEPTSYAYDGSILSDLLDRVTASSSKIEVFPVKLTSARLVRQGCLLHYDKLAYNDNYVRGSTDPAEAYFLNDEELDEQVAVSNAYLNCAKVSSPYLDSKFVDYISSKEDGAPFTLYWLDGQVIFVSEIKIP